MKKILFSAAMALVLVSCSRDEVIEVNRDSDVIEFGVVTNASTRAADVYCNNNKPGGFTVYANFNGKTYIDGDAIVYNETGGKWENTSGVRYWPNGPVSFYAHVNAGTAFKGSTTATTIENYTVPTAVANQKDLLYAVKTQSEGPVTLNFRHALSQIVFQAKNTNENLYVEIDGVTICNLGNVNTFTYPTADTDDNIINHGGVEGTITYNDSWGTWAVLNGGNTDYPVTFTAVPVPGDGAVKSLTNTNDTDKEFSSNAMLLLPQTTTAWAPAPDNGTPEKQDGTYFLVDCKIWNVAGDAHNDSDVVLWEGPAAVPVTINWEQGKKYIYTFVFGNGNGGYDPEPGPGPDPDNPDPTPDPEPVLIPITFEVTVDDFVPVANQDIKMETIE
jgi:hypothetical protein